MWPALFALYMNVCCLEIKTVIFVLFSVAYLGDIALDEEDMRMFKVDRIVNLAQRTVTILNNTETGKS